MSTEGEKPKIYVDEDWKSQVQAEREQQKSKVDRTSESSCEPEGALPPPTFEFLVGSIVSQALVELGQIPNPENNQLTIRLDLAQHHIEMLAMLEQKTKGNLTAGESQMLDDVLHQLRMAFVAISRHVQRAGS
jgi:hypothetical protein